MQDRLASQADVEAPPEVGCAGCHGTLEMLSGHLRCRRCGGAAERDNDGVLVFARSDDYWGEIDREHMRRLNAAVRRLGWRQAIETELGPSHPGLVDYVQHPARADWQVLLPLERHSSVVLDVGAGWGANSFALAANVKRVYAVEKVAERVEFIALRARQDGVANLVPIRADLHQLPFRESALDMIAVNGVLEWAGLVDPEAQAGKPARDPGELQRLFLHSLARLLRPGGSLYVGIENRFGANFWRGLPDHQGLRFTSLMPRNMARAYTRARHAFSDRTHRHETDYRAYTYSLRGYRSLLESAGFGDVQAYAAVGGYNVPALLIPLASHGPYRFLARRQVSALPWRDLLRRGIRLALATSGVAKQIASSYVFTARRRSELA